MVKIVSFYLITICFLLTCSPVLPCHAADNLHIRENLLNQAQKLQENHREVEALEVYENILHKEPDNFQALLNAAFMHLRIGWLYSIKDEQKDHYFMVYDYAKRAKLLNPLHYDARLLSIVAKAKITGYLSTKKQIKMVRKLKHELDRIVTLRGDDPDSIYILSWLNFKVGQVSPLERFVASLFFGDLPEDLTVPNAISLMKKAIAMRPEYSVYYYDLGIFHKKKGNLRKTRELFQKVISMQPQKPEDYVYIKKAKKQLQKLKSHAATNN